MRRPRMLFQTPTTWGDQPYYLARHEAEKTARRLRKIDGWDASLDECVVWYHVDGDEYEEPKSGSRGRFRYDPDYASWEPYEISWALGVWRADQ